MEQAICQITKQPFVISKDELEAYRFFGLPKPVLCPEERYRRLLSFVSTPQFFGGRMCQVTGQSVHTVFPASSPFPVIIPEYWQSDEWAPEQYAQDYDFKRLFIDQLLGLWRKVPRPAFLAANCSNLKAGHYCFNVHDSIFLFNAFNVNNSACCVDIWDSSFCADCYYVGKCEYCYECLHCEGCSRVRWGEFCTDCSDSWFLSHCKNCRNCLFCANLEGKEFHVFNQPVGEEEYRRNFSAADPSRWTFSGRQQLEFAKIQFAEFLARHPVPHIFADNIVRNSGNYLWRTQSAFSCFECSDCCDIIHCSMLRNADHCLEGLGFGYGLSGSAQFVSIGAGARKVVNCIDCWNNVEDLAYCTFCEDSAHLLGCVGLRGKEYCIFNQQFTKDSYEDLKNQIIRQLRAKGAWGKFLPPGFSAFPYNLSAGEMYLPLSRITAKMMGFTWDEEQEIIKPSMLLNHSKEPVEERFAEMPNNLGDLEEKDIGVDLYLCEISGKPYRFTKREYLICQHLEVAPPARSFEQRHLERIKRLGARKLNSRRSDKGGGEIITNYPAHWRQPVWERSEWRRLFNEPS